MTLPDMTAWMVLTKLKNSIQEQAVFPPWPELYNIIDKVYGYGLRWPHVDKVIFDIGKSLGVNIPTCPTPECLSRDTPAREKVICATLIFGPW